MRRPSSPLLLATAVLAAVTGHGAARPTAAPARTPAAARSVVTFASGVSAPSRPVAPGAEPAAVTAPRRQRPASRPPAAIDGAQGWRVETPTGWYGCTPSVEPAPTAGDAVPEALSITAEVSPGPYDAEGGLIAAKVYVTNNSDQVVRLTGRSLGTFLDADGHAVGGQFRAAWDEGSWGEGEPQDIEPYEYAEFRLELYPDLCGGSPDAVEPLGPGSYSLVVSLDWSTDEDAAGRWLSEPFPVPVDNVYGNLRPTPDVTADWHALDPAPDAPCRTDGTECGETWNVPPSCSTTTPANGDLGRGLRLTVEPDDDAVAGRSLHLTFTVTNEGTDVAWLTLDDRWDSGWLGSALLGDHASGRHEEYVGVRRYRLEPGRSMRVDGQVSTSTCAGAPLLPGPYSVTAGLYVEGFGWWLAPAATVVLRPV
jgi:hypothetical protein